MSSLESNRKPGPELLLLFTRFPHPTETFLQREVQCLLSSGQKLRLVSLWGGGRQFLGTPVECFNLWRLWTVLWRLPAEMVRSRGGFVADIISAMIRRSPAGWTNFWENLLGAGYALVEAPRLRRELPAHCHAVWASAPAAAAWSIWRLTGIPYSFGAHAYDLYEHGGDWLLPLKITCCSFVRTSTNMGATTLRGIGTPVSKMLLARRGLVTLRPLKSLRSDRQKLRLVCIARLVEKKGLERQLDILAAALSSGIDAEVRIYGDGPLRNRLDSRIHELGLTNAVMLMGHRPQSEVLTALDWADVLIHTGVVARSGDRDGLPNVIPEAMATGTIVATSPAAATTEAITHEQTGMVADVRDTELWISTLRRLSRDSELCERLRTEARRWVEENFDANRNTAQLLARIREEM
jgi:glycosyltransferase involved in cell wall biosynthesis